MDKSKVIWYVDMYDRVEIVCDANITIIEGIPALADTYTNFKARLVIVHEKMELLSIEDNGFAATKDLAWTNLAKSLKGITAGLRGYAKKTGNNVLLANAKYTKSAFTHDRGVEAIAVANVLLDLAQANITSLANYNVTPAKITAATGYLDVLTAYNSKPLAQRSTDKALLEVLIKNVREIRYLLKSEMDELVQTLEDEEETFYGEYFAARRIVHTGIRHEQPEGTTEAKKNTMQQKDQEDSDTKQQKDQEDSGTKKEEATTASKDVQPPELGSDSAESQPDTNGNSKPNEASPAQAATEEGV